MSFSHVCLPLGYTDDCCLRLLNVYYMCARGLFIYYLNYYSVSRWMMYTFRKLPIDSLHILLPLSFFTSETLIFYIFTSLSSAFIFLHSFIFGTSDYIFLTDLSSGLLIFPCSARYWYFLVLFFFPHLNCLTLMPVFLFHSLKKKNLFLLFSIWDIFLFFHSLFRYCFL